MSKNKCSLDYSKMNKEFAVIQGAFLSANRIVPLCSLQKADWDKVCDPILETIQEITQNKGRAEEVKKTLVCVAWLKLLSAEEDESIEVAWKESPIFSLQNGLPEFNWVVFLELIRSITSINIYTRLLLCLPPSQLCSEVERLVEHIRRSPVREEDVTFFFDVWWELWTCKDFHKDSTEEMFTQEVSRMSSKAIKQPAKRLKLDFPDQTTSNPDLVNIFFCAFRNLGAQITQPKLIFKALSVSINALYTAYLCAPEPEVSTKEKLEILSEIATIREKNNEKLGPKMIAESLKDLNTIQRPCRFKPLQLKFEDALQIMVDVAYNWNCNGLLEVEDKSNISYSEFKSKLGLQNVFAAFHKTKRSKDTPLCSIFEPKDWMTQKNVDLLPDVCAEIARTIISQKMDDYQNFALLFADEESWATCDENYIDFLETNQSAFREQNTLIKLTQSIVGKFSSGSVDVSHYRKLMKVTADIFSALSLDDKNKVLAAVMRISKRGFFGSNVPSAVTTSFERELNMAFNCIIQGGGGPSTASNLNTAVSLVARVAFQNPEAAVKAMCNSAISNKGSFHIMAKMLQQLPGLSGRASDSNQDAEGKDLLCSCVKDIIKTKQMSQDEKEQLVKFLSLLMQPVVMTEGDGGAEGFLLPQTVICAFVLPNLAVHSVDLELSLRLLHSALCLDHQGGASHWVMLCSPFPLLYVLAQLHNHTLRRWEPPTDLHRVSVWSMDTQELLVTVLSTLGSVVGAEVAKDPDTWSRALFWLYNKTEELDWTVRFLLKPVWGSHFKNEVPASLFAVCELPEQEWSGLDLPQYGLGTGLLAWTECCCISDSLQFTMLSHLSLDQSKPDHLGMFSKGLMVALTQTLPCCSFSQWSLLLQALRALIDSGRLHVPFSLEYCDYLPLLDLRSFACELRLSVLLLRVFQLLCGSSCSDWLSRDGWGHVGALYAHAVRDMIGSLKTKLPLSAAATGSANLVKESEKDQRKTEERESVLSQEVLFVLSQIYCHVQHVQVLLPGGQCEQLFLSSLELLSHYAAVMGVFPWSCSALESDNTRHFFTTITENLQNQEMKSVLQQKISQLVSSSA
ncbi:gem-associated protein 4 [Periophthalmus magnuspinnatus]|uniref:gem-associated protein 4 n=1 Tax=Periophthalmus magnuspinnatus TaxID=409849 RepID=UPI0024363737|nr:gem-associated protein 4 [Periophthalmus magnuspinnatus]